jgi:hypothetical protein
MLGILEGGTEIGHRLTELQSLLKHQFSIAIVALKSRHKKTPVGLSTEA